MYEESSYSPETDTTGRRRVYTVSQLNHEVNDLLSHSFPLLWLEGEISNLARPASGHLYFSLKDPQAQVRCAMFRNRNRQLGFSPENGQQVLVRARLSLYEPRGDYQLVIEHMEEAGDGALRRAYEALKEKLAKENLFSPEHKQPLPAIPRRVGVITSPSGAAVRDIISVLHRRFPALPVLIYPVPVQGAGAAEQIAQAIRLADRRRDCDILILARGGGSLEDLWAFNEEVVARAIYQCSLPIVSGIGHEIDFTIADFVSDQRAPTPSGAAELISPDQNEWQQAFHEKSQRLRITINKRLQLARQELQWLGKRFQQQHPGQRLQQRGQRLDELEQRLQRNIQTRLQHRKISLKSAHARLQQFSPLVRIEHFRTRYWHLQQRLQGEVQHRLSQARQQLVATSRALEAVSPLSTLARGYAIVTTATGQVIRRARDTRPGDTVSARLGRGHLICTVEETHDT